MTFHAKPFAVALSTLNSDEYNGLSRENLDKNRTKYGINSLTKAKKQGFFSRFFNALKEPMLIILLFGFVLAFGVNLGKYFKTGEADFVECFGILFAIILSVMITLIMEGSSQRAFAVLNSIYDNVAVKVLRDGKTLSISQRDVCVGDIILLESGEKIIADGRLIYSNYLTVDESALTGESNAVEKDANSIQGVGTPLAERINMVYSGTFITAGSGKMVVTAVGDNTEIGKIAGELKEKNHQQTPLQQKLNKLSKIITITGGICAVIVFVLSVVKLLINGNFTFNNLQELFVSCIILIVAAVPEGLPTIVAVSLALNMIKLAKENALIKKMTATETAGAVSVICSDKTGTLTQNKMSVLSVCMNEYCTKPDRVMLEPLLQNFVCNNSAEVIMEKNKKNTYRGSATECALLSAFEKNSKGIDVEIYRRRYPVLDRTPFKSESKIMHTVIGFGDIERTLIKGAPEVVLPLCDLSEGQRKNLITSMLKHQKKSCRILCFAHGDSEKGKTNNATRHVYDGYVVISDPIRPEVKKAVFDCKRAGIKIKMLTGDNLTTAFSIAKELKISDDESSIINGSDLDKLSDEELKRLLPKINVIARSTPIIKLKVVKALKELGEVVAVTGDGINDAPAIKQADVGFAMGKTGSEICKEAADVVLLDDSFSSVVKAVAFGRNVYRNLQRFILFQLSVNLSALLFVTISAILGLPSPFNTIQLLWINIIMDGPPALTLGLESGGADLMKEKPLKRNEGIVSGKMFLRILFNGVYISAIMLGQYVFNLLNIPLKERSCALFTIFVLFQLFNAFNSRGTGSESVFKSITSNKVMLITFGGVLLLHLLIVQFAPVLFGVSSMCFLSWIKCFFTAFSIVVVSELAKFVYRQLNNKEGCLGIQKFREKACEGK